MDKAAARREIDLNGQPPLLKLEKKLSKVALAA
jgi:hypothetical protein